MEHRAFEKEQDFVNILWPQLIKLCPKHRELHLLVPKRSLEFILVYIRDLANKAIHFAYPRPQLPLTTSLQDFVLRGGWSIQDVGPKIPSLM